MIATLTPRCGWAAAQASAMREGPVSCRAVDRRNVRPVTSSTTPARLPGSAGTAPSNLVGLTTNGMAAPALNARHVVRGAAQAARSRSAPSGSRSSTTGAGSRSSTSDGRRCSATNRSSPSGWPLARPISRLRCRPARSTAAATGQRVAGGTGPRRFRLTCPTARSWPDRRPPQRRRHDRRGRASAGAPPAG
ncbi:hypothetical protein HBB16_11545 [Pseudonocardia sp. MCCB 268]|nr:hypothetical protein [Pseudonocardia cytotoxica]